MNIQRYVVRGCNSDGWHTEKTKEYPDMQGRWVLFKDHKVAINEAVAKNNEAVLQLVAERERRVAAEEVVDAAILMPFELNKMVEAPVSHELAIEYRAKFPKGDDHG